MSTYDQSNIYRSCNRTDRCGLGLYSLFSVVWHRGDVPGIGILVGRRCMQIMTPDFFILILDLELAHVRVNLNMCFRTGEQSVQTTYEDIEESVDWILRFLQA